MQSGKLKQISDLSRLVVLEKKYGAQFKNMYNNAYLFPPLIDGSIATEKIWYEETEHGLVCYFDLGTHYRMVFSMDVRDEYTAPNLDKKICCEFITPASRQEAVRDSFHLFLQRNGFGLTEEFQQQSLCLNGIYEKAAQTHESDMAKLRSLNMFAGAAQLSRVDELEAIIRDFISEYDTMDYTAEEWRRQIDAGNVVCLYRDQEIAAAYCFAPDGGRVVVKPQFRGLNLGLVLRKSLYFQDRWKTVKNHVHVWVHPDNISSTKSDSKLFGEDAVILTGKMKYRYIKPAGKEELK